VGLDDGGLLVGEGGFLCDTEFLDETHWLALETALEPSACTGVDKVDKLCEVESTYVRGGVPMLEEESTYVSLGVPLLVRRVPMLLEGTCSVFRSSSCSRSIPL
jgi:hypothetical protein